MVRVASGSSMRNSCTCHGSPSDAAEVMNSAGSELRHSTGRYSRC
jgi:hypothetical protein